MSKLQSEVKVLVSKQESFVEDNRQNTVTLEKSTDRLRVLETVQAQHQLNVTKLGTVTETLHTLETVQAQHKSYFSLVSSALVLCIGALVQMYLG